MELLKVSVGVLWLINLGLLIWYMAEQEVNGWNVTALIGVALTGIVPMLRAAYNKYTGKDYKEREGWTSFLHVTSGVIGTAGSGLALGYAAQCGKSSYANIEMLIAAAVVNGLSGVVAHFAFIDEEERKKIYKDQSAAYDIPRGYWYFFILLAAFVVSVLTLGWNSNNAYATECKNEDHYSLYLISPVTHLVGSLVLGAFQANKGTYMPHVPSIVNFTIMHTAAILSMFGLNLTYGWGGDWVIVIPVYLYLALAHLKVVPPNKVAATRVPTDEPQLS